jgi:hypothetical protein
VRWGSPYVCTRVDGGFELWLNYKKTAAADFIAITDLSVRTP